VFERTNAVWIDGGAITNDENYFWENIIAQLNIPSEVENNKTHELGFEISADGQLKIPFLSAGISASSNVDKGFSTSHSTKLSVSNKTAAIRFLSENKVPLIVDDFHYIGRDAQTAIVRALKAPIMHGLPVVFIAIPNRKFDVLKVEREMTGRLEVFEIPSWSIDELAVIAEIGFRELNVIIPDALSLKMSEEALGSPHLMQEFCKAICEKNRIEKAAHKSVHLNADMNMTELFHSIAMNTGRSLFDKLARGPRQRSDRIDRRLKDGTITDIYGAVMAALLKMKPGMESVNYDIFRGYLRDVLDSELPQMHEVSRVLEKLAEISYNAGASTPVIDWDSDDDLLTVTDPFFAFYLRWKDEMLH
jgi:hypothetical protein